MNLRTLRLRRRLLAITAITLLGTLQMVAQVQQGGRGGAGGGAAGGGGAGGTSSGTRSYQNTTLIGDATISGDADSRQIIVVTDALTNESIRAVIASLDKPRPQVLINVVFMQVTHDNSFDLGAEAKYKGPVSIHNDGVGTATSKFGIAAQLASPTGYGAFYELVARGGDLTATVHALSGVSKAEVLSRPSILTRSNQQATILVGQKVPLVGTTTQNSNGGGISTTSTVEYTDVGIILRVTPFITQEGLVEMIVSPEISSISPTTVNIPGAGNATVIDRRAADTVVVTPSDQTIVIGGLISSQNNNIDSKVPILGDIPIIGYAFKRKTKTDVKTELLIFLTPHVVKTPADLAALSDGERSRLDISPVSFNKADLSKFLPGVPQANAQTGKP